MFNVSQHSQLFISSEKSVEATQPRKKQEVFKICNQLKSRRNKTTKVGNNRDWD